MESSQSQYDRTQVDRALKRINERKKARAQARDEEERYVEFRRQQILSSFQPSMGAMRIGDDAFPKRRRGSMGFGERKAHYLSIRPNPKFATWLGMKKGGGIAAKPHALPPALVNITDHSVLDEQNNANMQMSPKVKTDEATSLKSAIDTKSSLSKSAYHRLKSKRRGNNADAPMINGNPFWLPAPGAPNDSDEMTDEDLPVDMDVLEKVCKGKMVLAQKPFQKSRFNPYGPIDSLKFDDALFQRETHLFTSTIEAVICLQLDEELQRMVPPAPIQRKIVWGPQLKQAYYDPIDRQQPTDGPYLEEFRDIKREQK